MVSICIVLPRELSLCQDLVDFFKFFFFLRWECAENLGRVFFIWFQRSSAFHVEMVSCKVIRFELRASRHCCNIRHLERSHTTRRCLARKRQEFRLVLMHIFKNKLAKVYLGTSCYLFKNMKLSFLGKIFTNLSGLHNYLLRSIWLPHFFFDKYCEFYKSGRLIITF